MRHYLPLGLGLLLCLQNLWGASSPYEKILSHLYNTKGDYSRSMPTLEIRKTQKVVAAYWPNSQKIIIEEKALEICRSLGADSIHAIAFLIAHELHHFYAQDSASNNFAYDKTFQQNSRTERAADIGGALTAYLADYQLSSIIPTLIDKIYSTYQIDPTELKSYPTKAERQNTWLDLNNEIQRLINIFDAAHYLGMSGQYNAAEQSYDHLLTKYQSFELFINAAVNQMRYAVSLEPPDQQKFYYPWMIDLRSRLKSKKPKIYTRDDNTYKQQEALRKAQKYLEKAKLFHPKSEMLAQNQLILAILLGQHKQVLVQEVPQKPEFELIKAIALCKAGQIKEGHKMLQQLKENPDPWIAYLATVNSTQKVEPSNIKASNLEHLQQKLNCQVNWDNDQQTIIQLGNGDQVKIGKYESKDRIVIHDKQFNKWVIEKYPLENVVLEDLLAQNPRIVHSYNKVWYILPWHGLIFEANELGAFKYYLRFGKCGK